MEIKKADDKEKNKVIKLTEEIRKKIALLPQCSGEEKIFELIEEAMEGDSGFSIYGFKEKAKLAERIYLTLRKDLGILEPYIEDEEITEIMVNGRENIFVERRGIIEKTEMSFSSTEELEELIRRIAAGVHREINELSPIVDARLPDGSRVNAVYKNIALNGPILTIRKFPKKAFTMQDMISYGTLTEEAADFLNDMVKAGMNIMVSGGTSSGKTSLLNVLSNAVPAEERVIVIEDSAELQLDSIENIVRMECRNSNVQGRGEVDMRQLIKSSLRMRPNRIIVGEVRGAEVLDMLQAMNTGHDGSLSTGHANSANGMLRRMETMVLQAVDFPVDAVRNQIAEGIDLMVHLGRLPDRSRKILEISELYGYENGSYLMNVLFKYTGNGLEPTGNRIINREKLKLRGYEGSY